MEMKSSAPYAPPPPYGETTFQPQPQPPSYSYSPPYPPTSWTPNHPTSQATTEIGFVEVNTIHPNIQPPTVVHVVHDPGYWQSNRKRTRCCLSTFISLLITILVIFAIVKVLLR